MGKKSTKTNTKSSVQYGNTTTSNPYATATTNNAGTAATFQSGNALESIYNFVNKNIDSMLDEYLNPSINSKVNQAKLNAYQNALSNSTYQNLENDIINPLSNRRMIRSSQATDLYKNLSKQNTNALDNYITELLSSSQNETASMLNNLLQMYMQGYDVLSDMSNKSLKTSAGNATKSTNSTQTISNGALNDIMNVVSKAAEIYKKFQTGGTL